MLTFILIDFAHSHIAFANIPLLLEHIFFIAMNVSTIGNLFIVIFILFLLRTLAALQQNIMITFELRNILGNLIMGCKISPWMHFIKTPM